MRASLAGAAQYPDPSLGTQACWHLTCGSVPADPYGLLDITENVWEWIRQAYTGDRASRSKNTTPGTSCRIPHIRAVAAIATTSATSDQGRLAPARAELPSALR